MKNWFRRQDKGEGIAHDLYVAAVAQARQPLFYVEYGVPDTVDGRFDLIILHVYLFLRQLLINLFVYKEMLVFVKYQYDQIQLNIALRYECQLKLGFLILF